MKRASASFPAALLSTLLFAAGGCLGPLPRRGAELPPPSIDKTAAPGNAPTPAEPARVDRAAAPAVGLAGEPPHRAVVLCAGDTNPGVKLAPILRAEGMAYPFASIKPFLAGADVLFLNLETPVGTKRDPFPKKYNFLAPPDSANMLLAAGVPRVVAGLANNHTLDHGAPALEETLEILDGLGVGRCGAGRTLAEARKPAFAVVYGSTIAFLAYSYAEPHEFYAGPDRAGTSPVDFEAVKEDVAQAKTQARWVVVAIHWGMEYDTTVFGYQPELARIAIDAGADLVVGHHAHTIQGSDVYKGKPIVYGLGNFVFGTANAKAKGALLKAFFSDGGTRLELIPVDENNFVTSFRPRLFEGPALDKSLKGVQGLSPSLPWRRDGDRLVWP